MKKDKYKQLVITIIFTTIVLGTLYYMYDLFSFHTYNQRVYYDAVANADTEIFTLENYEIYQDEKVTNYGNAILQIKDSNKLIEKLPNTNMNDTLNVIITIKFNTNNSSKEVEVVKEYAITLEENGIFVLPEEEIVNKKLKFATITTAEIKIVNNDSQITYPLDITSMTPLKSASKEYRIETASISNNTLRLGKLVAGYDMADSYDTISMEYRYMKDNNGDVNDIDNYVVFKKVSGTIEEYVNTKYHGTYVYDGEDAFEDKKISVVVILSKGEEEYIFSMNMEKDITEVQHD
ncbi:MAG: hypothetical protein ACK5LC_15550 [Coprobacillaceae bacterium]